MNIKTVKACLKALNIRPKKSLGQHFLTNEEKIKVIISEVKKFDPSFIMEIGPGLGALTKPLLKLKKTLRAVEMDKVLTRHLRKEGVDVLYGDVLKISWGKHLKPGSVLVGNLPYQPSARLLVQCCPPPRHLKSMVLMFQKEVALRIKAKPGNKTYGLLSVLSQCYWNVRHLTTICREDFYPVPKVAGEVLVFTKKHFDIFKPAVFLLFVKHCFQQRRKILINQLKPVVVLKRTPDLSVELKNNSQSNLLTTFKQLKISLKARPEELSPAEFVKLYHKIANPYLL